MMQVNKVNQSPSDGIVAWPGNWTS